MIHKKNTCNTADHIFVLPDALHNSAIIQGYYQETIFPIATSDQKVFRWRLQCGKALFSKLNIFSQGSRYFARWKNIRANSKEGILPKLTIYIREQIINVTTNKMFFI